MNVTNTVRSLGINDRHIDLFEGQYTVPNGMAYNSYIILDEKIAVLDTVGANFGDEWLQNLKQTLNGKTPDYLIVQHMEPDHSANIMRFFDVYPSATLVSSAKAFTMIQGFFGTDFSERRIVVGDGDTLALGAHTLSFITAPMVHWPEVIMTYDSKDKILFSADAFGKFGTIDTNEPWETEARRYYIGIVGKYGAQVQAVLKKVAGLDIEIICSLHGPILRENLGYYIGLYDTWSSYRPEQEGVVIAYTSVYGHTKDAVRQLEAKLRSGGAEVVTYDLARSDIFAAIADAFRYNKLVLATTTYNGGIFPFMHTFINHLTERNFQGRTVGLIENGTWAPVASKVIRAMLEKSKEITYTDTTVQIRSALCDKSRAQLEAFAAELLK